MTRKRKRRKDPSTLGRVAVHPILHTLLKLSAIEENTSIQDRLHAILCHEYDRMDLLMQDPMPAQAQ